MTVDSTGHRIAMAAGDGGVWTVRLADGLLRRQQLGDRVVKAVIFDVDGGDLFASGMSPPFLTHTSMGDEAVALAGARSLRRLAALPDGSLVGLDLDAGLFRWATRTALPSILGPDRSFSDVERDGDALVVLDGLGAVERFDGTTFTGLATVPDARAVALRGGRIAIASPNGVELREGSEVRHLAAVGASLLDVALSYDGSRVAAAGMDATVRVWDTSSGALVGVLPGHAERVVAVEFLPDGDLVTASWDKTARIWSLAALVAPVPTLARDVAAAWGYDRG